MSEIKLYAVFLISDFNISSSEGVGQWRYLGNEYGMSEKEACSLAVGGMVVNDITASLRQDYARVKAVEIDEYGPSYPLDIKISAKLK
jgi:hypothetical protein